MNVIGLALILACTPTALLNFAIPKWKADKNVHIEDAYKWIYQATRGGEHAAPDRASAREWLDREWQGLDLPATNETLWEPLCRDGSIGRLNLRVFRTKGGKENDILDAFLASSREYREVGTSFTDAWTQLGKRLKKHALGTLIYDEWKRLDTEMALKDYPVVHHSNAYEKAEKPAYRVLTKAEMKRLKTVTRAATYPDASVRPAPSPRP